MSADPARRPPTPAAFGRRYAAWSLDMAVVLALSLLICGARMRDGAARIAAAFDAIAQAMAGAMADLLLHGATPLDLARQWLVDPAQRTAVTALSDAIVATVLPPLLVAGMLSLAWFALFEASPWQATPGKRLLDLRVAGDDGARLGLARAAGRHLAGTLSWITLNLGHLLALVPPRRQALHDRIAGARVLQDVAADACLPAWAVAWLLLQAATAFAATAWLFVATQLAMQRAFDALLP